MGNEFGDGYERADANAPGDVIVMSGESRELPLETFDKPCFDKTSALCYEGMVASTLCPPGVTLKMDCTDLLPLGGWIDANRGQPVMIFGSDSSGSRGELCLW